MSFIVAGGSPSLESIQDLIGPSFTDSSTIDFTYSDVGNTISAAVISPLLMTSDGTAGAPSYSWASDTDTGFYRSGANSIGVSANGVNTLLFDTTGITPATADTYILGDTTLRWLQVASKRYFGNPSETAATPTYSFATDTNTGIYRSGADELSFATGGSQRAKIDSSGITSFLAQVQFIKGGSSTPGIAASSDPTTGIQLDTNDIEFRVGSSLKLFMSTSGITPRSNINIDSAINIDFSSSTGYLIANSSGILAKDPSGNNGVIKIPNTSGQGPAFYNANQTIFTSFDDGTNVGISFGEGSTPPVIRSGRTGSSLVLRSDATTGGINLQDLSGNSWLAANAVRVSLGKPFLLQNTTSGAVSSPEESMMIYDTVAKKLKFYNGTTWETVTSI